MAWAMHSIKVVLLTVNKCALSKISEKQISNVYVINKDIEEKKFRFDFFKPRCILL